MFEQARKQKLDMTAVYPPLAKVMECENVFDPNQLPLDYSLKAIIKNALYEENFIFSSVAASTLIRDVVGCALVLNTFSFKVYATSTLGMDLFDLNFHISEKVFARICKKKESFIHT